MVHLSLNRIRELTSSRIGLLTRISGQVVRTHPVHPELVSGTFLCLDCQTVIKDVEQQFKYTQPNICRNPVCANRRRFLLDTNKSRFVDFQKVFFNFCLFQIQSMLIIHFQAHGSCYKLIQTMLNSVFMLSGRSLYVTTDLNPKLLMPISIIKV